jgi:hypothetical protein
VVKVVAEIPVVKNAYPVRAVDRAAMTVVFAVVWLAVVGAVEWR